MRPPNLPVIQIKGIYFKNPFAILPHPNRLTYPNGRVTPELLMYYKAMARSEAALTITGPATVAPPNSRKFSLLRVDQPKYLDGLRALIKIIESNGAMPGVQITHPGLWDCHNLPPGVWQGTLVEFPPEKIITAFKNACERSLEVGYRYVELNACDHLMLHRLVEEDREDVLTTIFENCINAVGNTFISAIRFHPGSPHLEKYARRFLALGGDIICYQPIFDHSFELPLIRKGNCMFNLASRVEPKVLPLILERNNLIGLPVEFKDKSAQIMDFFRAF